MQPTQLGPYKIIKKLGEGGMGTVFEGVNQDDQHHAAIKLLSPTLATRRGFRDRFDGEIETLRRLRHPNIVSLVGFGEQDDQLFYAMDYVAGQNLEEILNDLKKFTCKQVVDIGLQLAAALKHAHNRGIIHRDIKPANIMFTAEGVAKLTDFGIAKLYGYSGLTMSGGPVGTANYMAPEQTDGSPISGRADLYALGGTFYTLLAGRPPFVAESLMQMLNLQKFHEPDPVSKYAPDVPETLDLLIRHLLKKDPANRIPTAVMLTKSLEAIRLNLALPTNNSTQPNTQTTISHANTTPTSSTNTPTLPPTPQAQPVINSQDETLVSIRPNAKEFSHQKSASPKKTGDTTALTEKKINDTTTPIAPNNKIDDSTVNLSPNVQNISDIMLQQTSQTNSESLPANNTAISRSRVVSEHENPNETLTNEQKVGDSPDRKTPAAQAAIQSPPSSSLHQTNTTSQTTSLDEQTTTSVFITAEEANTHEQQQREFEEQQRPRIIALRTIGTVLFFIIGLPLVWWLLTPPNADQTYQEIIRLKIKADNGNATARETAELAIIDFRTRFPNEPRVDELNNFKEELALQGFKGNGSRIRLRVSSPIQHLFLDAISYEDLKPEKTIASLKALITLCSDPAFKISTRDQRYVDKANEHLKKMELRLAKQLVGQRKLLQERIVRAKNKAVQNPVYSRKLCQAMLTLFGDQKWAKPQLDQVRQLLSQLPKANKASLPKPKTHASSAK